MFYHFTYILHTIYIILHIFLTNHDRDVLTVVINNLHHFTYILSFYILFTYILSFLSFYIYLTYNLHHFCFILVYYVMKCLWFFSYPLKSITKMNFIFLILSVHVLIKADLVFNIKLIYCDECNNFFVCLFMAGLLLSIKY